MDSQTSSKEVVHRQSSTGNLGEDTSRLYESALEYIMVSCIEVVPMSLDLFSQIEAERFTF